MDRWMLLVKQSGMRISHPRGSTSNKQQNTDKKALLTELG